MRYICIGRRRTQYPVRMMCRLLKVSSSGYYAWRVRPESQRAQTDRELTRVIRRLHADSQGVYGSPKMRDELKDEGYRCGRHKVARLMRLAGLRGCPKRRFKITTECDPSHPVAKNLLRQDFAAEAPNQRWASDITYSAPSLWRRPGRRCQGLSMSGMHFGFHKDERGRMPAICYEVARAEAAVTCRTLAG